MTQVMTTQLLIVAALSGVVGFAQTNVAGEWHAQLTTPGGPLEFDMYLNQDGTELSGRMTSPSGEFPLTGSVKGDEIELTWSLPDGAELLEIAFTGRVIGTTIRGTATIGRLGKGAMSAERTD